MHVIAKSPQSQEECCKALQSHFHYATQRTILAMNSYYTVTQTQQQKKQVRTTETKENKIVIEALPMTMAQGNKTVLGRSKVLSQMLATTRSIS